MRLRVCGFHQGQGCQSLTPAKGRIYVSNGFSTLSAYAATKHAVAGLTKVLAVELGPDGINANYLIPGVILTAMTRPIMESDPAMKTAFEASACSAA